MKPATPKVLIADDGDAISIGLGALLKERGIEVDVTGSSGLDAWRGPYDLLIIDPLIASEEIMTRFIERLRASNPSIQIIAVSEFVEAERLRVPDAKFFNDPAHVTSCADLIESSLLEPAGKEERFTRVAS